MSRADYDIVGAEVHRKALANLTNEMAITMTRTSGSPTVVDGKDFSACLLDTTPEHLDFAAYVLFHIGTSVIGTAEVSKLAEQIGDLAPGDGFLVNDPHLGGAAHQGDVAVITPMFHGDHHLGWAFSNMHVLDVGGAGVGGFAPGAHDVYQEGMRFPPTRVIRGGAIQPEWEGYIGANTRMPGPVLNDIRGMIASNNVASRKLREIVDRFGLERYSEFCEINKDLTEQTLRRRIEAIPDGVYSAVEWVEFDGHGEDLLLELRLRAEVDGSDLLLEFSGVPQVDAYINACKGSMYGQTLSALLPMLAFGDLPVNGGFLRPIRIDLGEPGSIVNATLPAPVSSGHVETGGRACRLVREVMHQAMGLSDDPVIRSRVGGQPQEGYAINTMWGRNQHGGTSQTAYFESVVGTGGGATPLGDGQDTYGESCTTGSGVPDVELHESQDPVVWAWRRIVPNAGGPGAHRGGLALEQATVVAYTELLGGPAFNLVAQIPPRGTGGGYPASTSNFYLLRDSNYAAETAAGRLRLIDELDGERITLQSKEPYLQARRGDALVFTGGGGGGLGDPLLRDPQAVARDFRDGYITRGHALAAYGVTLTDAGEADEAATVAEREQIRGERIGAEPRRPLTAPHSIGVSVVEGESDTWDCASCGHGLAPGGENWREGAVLRESPIAERYAELEMYVRERTEEPAVMLREHFCPTCAACLTVDVAIAGLPTLEVPTLRQAVSWPVAL